MWTTSPPANLLANERAGAAPDHVRQRGVDNKNPECKEQGDGLELHAAGNGTGDDGRGDHGKRHLERDVNDRRIGRVRGWVGRLVQNLLDNGQAKQLVKAAKERDGAVAAVGKRPSGDNPENANDANDNEGHEHGVGNVLTPSQSAVEKSKARRHKEHEHGTDKHKAGGTCIKHVVSPSQVPVLS